MPNQIDPRIQQWLQAFGGQPAQGGTPAQGGGPATNPQWQQIAANADNRRYANFPTPNNALDQPTPGGAQQYRDLPIGQWSPTTVQNYWARLNAEQANPLRPVANPNPTQAAPKDWTQQGMWNYGSGQNPLNGVPYEEWGDALSTLNATYPYASLDQQRAQQAQQGQQWQQQFGATQGQQQWDNKRAGQNDAFNQWLAQQQLAQQQSQAGADNGWRNRQLDLQAGAQQFAQVFR